MAKLQLTCDALGDLDGGAVRLAVNKVLDKLFRDIEDRGDDGEDRTLEIKLKLKRRENGEIGVITTCKATVPAFRGPGTTCSATMRTGKPELFFQSQSPDNPSQRTIDEAMPQE